MFTTHPLTDLPVLNSHPGAPVNLFLDFDGHFQATWESYSNIVTPAFSIDADVTTFSDEELVAIVEIFSRVAEDFSPFNVNVTTVEPTDLSNGHGLRVAIGGGSDDWLGGVSGGFSYIDTFTNSTPNVVYAFPENLNDADPTFIADVCSHEAGHAFGLKHQREFLPNGQIFEYYDGDATTAPLMGNSYTKVRSRWWLGPTDSVPSVSTRRPDAQVAVPHRGHEQCLVDHQQGRKTETAQVRPNNHREGPPRV